MTAPEISNGSPIEVLKVLAGGEPRDLRTLQGKLTFTGARKKSVPSLVFTTFHHLPRMDWFPSADDGGSDSVVWHFATTPEEMMSAVASLARLDGALQRAAPAHLSLALALKESRLGDLAFATTLDRDAAKAAFDAIQGSLDRTNGLARAVMQLHRQAVFGPR